MAALASTPDSLHVHVDLDVIDTSEGYANEYAAGGGPSLEALEATLAAIGGHCGVNSVSLTSYNPSVDQDGRALDAGLRLLDGLGRLLPRT